MKRRVVKCPYCKKKAVFLKSSTPVYQKDRGPLWMCWECDAYVGCHGGTDKPLGTMANQRLRDMRRSAHRAFDQSWTGKNERIRAYRWLAEKMGIEVSKCHIGEFNIAQCKQVMDACRENA